MVAIRGRRWRVGVRGRLQGGRLLALLELRVLGHAARGGPLRGVRLSLGHVRRLRGQILMLGLIHAAVRLSGGRKALDVAMAIGVFRRHARVGGRVTRRPGGGRWRGRLQPNVGSLDGVKRRVLAEMQFRFARRRMVDAAGSLDTRPQQVVGLRERDPRHTGFRQALARGLVGRKEVVVGLAAGLRREKRRQLQLFGIATQVL